MAPLLGASPGPAEGPGSRGPTGAGMQPRLPDGLVFQEKEQVWIWGWQPLISQSWQSRPHTQPGLWGAFLRMHRATQPSCYHPGTPKAIPDFTWWLTHPKPPPKQWAKVLEGQNMMETLQNAAGQASSHT